MNKKNTYSPIYALDQANFGRCYYCGCEATEQDFVPPLKFIEFYEKHYGTDYRMEVPCCVECRGFLTTVNASNLEDRLKIVKKCISSKYKKALRIYSSWDSNDLDELSNSLKKSISAGISLGEEASNRLRFDGYSYEYEGQRQYSTDKQCTNYEVLGEKFDKLRDALLFASRSYKINIHKLEDYFLQTGGDISEAVATYFSDAERALLDKKIKEQCVDFCKLHNQSQKFVEKTVRIYIDRFEGESIEWCLDKIYRERVIG
ncbi:hypothetical protein [Pseudomonas fluorescens]|uniref:Uncharacterized protein n=1 Tax=Pseudomonas fluorescens TaxID=294 RepID=A0A5E7LB60_PSEFL|nr:hypothetical protein [Pseudomonas fluorescens]VVP08728.1 hypothetical protein PS880_03204 [Pseudomonas fluorescens]